MARTIGGLFAGLIAAIVAMLAIAFAGGQIYPMSAEVDAINPEQIGSAFAATPLGAKLIVILSWFGAAFVGGFVAKRITGANWAVWTIAGLFAVYVLITIFVLPMPPWMQVTAVAAPLAGGLLASHAARPRGRASGVGREPGEGVHGD
jgi:hypothetical protein